jgi:hypothetical protein
LPNKINVVPQTGSLTISPVTVAAVVDVTEGNADHERAVLEKTRLWVLYEPHSWVEVIYDLLAPKNQGVSKR